MIADPLRPAWRVNIAEALLDDRLPAGSTRPAIRFPGGEWSLEELAQRVGGLAGGHDVHVGGSDLGRPDEALAVAVQFGDGGHGT